MHDSSDRRLALKGLAALAAAPAALSVAPAARAQQAGGGNAIRLIHGYAAGQSPDVLARQIAPGLSEKLAANIIVEARPGAGERLAASQIGRLAPDGQSLYIMTGGLTVITAVDRSIRFDLLKDFTYISMLTQYPFMFWVGANSPFKTLADLLAAARERPGQLNYATTGVANTLHMSVELLSSMTGVKMTHVAYKDSGAYTDLVGGGLDMSVGTAATAQGLMREGRVRPLCVTSPARWPGWETVPAIAESVPGYEVVTWAALTAPVGLPDGQRDRFNKAIRDVLAQPALQSQFATTGSVARPTSPDEMRARVESDVAKWKKVADYAKIQLN